MYSDAKKTDKMYKELQKISDDVLRYDFSVACTLTSKPTSLNGRNVVRKIRVKYYVEKFLEVYLPFWLDTNKNKDLFHS